MKSNSSYIAFAAAIMGMLLFPSFAQAQFVIVADTAVCGTGTGLNVLAIINGLRESQHKVDSIMVIGGLHGGEDGTVADDKVDPDFFKNISIAVRQAEIQYTPLMSSSATINKTFKEAVGNYDAILLAWCHSGAWYDRTGRYLGQGLTKVSFETAN